MNSRLLDPQSSVLTTELRTNLYAAYHIALTNYANTTLIIKSKAGVGFEKIFLKPNSAIITYTVHKGENMRTIIQLICPECNKSFEMILSQHKHNIKRNCLSYCSITCSNRAHNKQILVTCIQCNNTFYKKRAEYKKGT